MTGVSSTLPAAVFPRDSTFPWLARSSASNRSKDALNLAAELRPSADGRRPSDILAMRCLRNASFAPRRRPEAPAMPRSWKTTLRAPIGEYGACIAYLLSCSPKIDGNTERVPTIIDSRLFLPGNISIAKRDDHRRRWAMAWSGCFRC